MITIGQITGYIMCGKDCFYRDEETNELRGIDGDTGSILNEEQAKGYLVMNKLNHHDEYREVIEGLEIDENTLIPSE